jgi:hypothetical protein
VAWWRIVPDGKGGEQLEDPQTVSVVLVAGAAAIDASAALAGVEGCWVLKTDSIDYEPLGLPSDFRVRGLSVRAVVAPTVDVATDCWAGPIVRVLSIERR